ncbi:HK97 family phage prohead protease [Bacillus sp. RG28]|uniref:HK97 family phage prohead protease n=1 Tax=Gottfriedia endophytica TaxID=2820819 RepID=A0A940NRA9_9BACI|nr:HK97 family phage prohead protease [Gottfriedia endophytica]MBP0725542.1 HK97 family phage prohead protease [Gottfriedia endophytica]
MKVEKRTLTFQDLQIRQSQNDGDEGKSAPKISGYAAVYNSESELLYGFFKEVIRPGAFDNSINNDVRCLFNHDSSKVLGRTVSNTLKLTSDAKGLYFEVTPPDAVWAEDLLESIKRGDINQMSFGFTVNDDKWETLADGTDLRELLDVNLFEVSVVTFPAYQATTVSARSTEEIEEESIKKRFEQRKKPLEPKRFFDYQLKLMKMGDY